MKKRKYFTVVPHLALDDTKLNGQARNLYVHYCRVMGAEMSGGESVSRCWDGVGETAQHLGMSTKTVIANRNLLEELGYIKTEKLYRKRDRRWVLSVAVVDRWEENEEHYRLIYHPTLADVIVKKASPPITAE